MPMGEEQASENQQCNMFLAHQNRITLNLKADLEKIVGYVMVVLFNQLLIRYEDVVTTIVTMAADIFEEGSWVTPPEKHTLLRVIPFGLFLIDGQENIFKTKKFGFDRFRNIFKRHPVVPMFGDMTIVTTAYIERCTHYDPRLYSCPPDDKLAVEYEIVNHLEEVRSQHLKYVSKFSQMINELRTTGSANLSSEKAKDIYDFVLQGLQMIAQWSAWLMECSAWKYYKPTESAPAEALEYEKVVRYNYSPADRTALIECIAMAKGLGGMMRSFDSLLAPLLRRVCHVEIQEFLQGMNLIYELFNIRYIERDDTSGCVEEEASHKECIATAQIFGC